MPDPEQTPGSRRQDLVRRLARPAVALAGAGMLLVFAAAAATAGLEAALGLPGTLIAVIAMVVSGDPAAGVSIATPLLASPWNVIGQGLPPSAALSAARGMVYPGGANLTGPLAVLATYAAAGTVLTFAATAWRRHRPAPRAPQRAAQAGAAAAEVGLAA